MGSTVSALATRRTLVLNADYRPLATYPLSTLPVDKAICAVVRDRVTVLDTWEEAFHSPSVTMLLPKVVVLKDYANVYADPKFCRRSIFLRDRYCCQFCGKGPFNTADLTFDHVIPRAKGGKTVWENILTCCIPCNMDKRDQSANWSAKKGSGLRPLKEPRQPTSYELLANGLEMLSDEDRQNWGSFLYWDVELEA